MAFRTVGVRAASCAAPRLPRLHRRACRLCFITGRLPLQPRHYFYTAHHCCALAPSRSVLSGISLVARFVLLGKIGRFCSPCGRRMGERTDGVAAILLYRCAWQYRCALHAYCCQRTLSLRRAPRRTAMVLL